MIKLTIKLRFTVAESVQYKTFEIVSYLGYVDELTFKAIEHKFDA